MGKGAKGEAWATEAWARSRARSKRTAGRPKPTWARAIMKQIFFALFLGAFFYFVGFAAERAHIPPFNIVGENIVPILFAVIGLVVGFWLGNR